MILFNNLREQLGKDLTNFTLETKAEGITHRDPKETIHSFHLATSEGLNLDASSSSSGADKAGQRFCSQLHKLGAIPRLAGINTAVP